MAMLDGGALTHRAAAADSGGAVGSVENRLFNTALAHLQQQVPPLAMAHSGGASVAPEQTQLALTTLSRLFQSVLSDAAPNSPGLARPFQRAFVRHATDHAGADVAAQALTQALPHLQLMHTRTAADVLASIGALATQRVHVFHATLSLFQLTGTTPPDDRAVAQLLLGLLCEPVDPSAPPNESRYAVHWSSFGPCIGTLNANISWPHVVALLDELATPATQPDAEQAYGLAVVAAHARRLAHPTVLDALWDHAWHNPLAQLMLIRGLLMLDSKTFDMSSWVLHRIVSPETLPMPALADTDAATKAAADAVVATLKAQAAQLTSSRWNNQDLANLLSAGLGVENAALRTIVADLLDKAVKQNADLILIGFGQVPPPWPDIHTSFCLQLVTLVLSAFQPNVPLVLWCLFQSSPSFSLRALAHNVTQQPANLPRIFTVLHELGLIPQATDPLLILPSTPTAEVALVFELANLADRNERFDLPQWLDRSISAHPHAFVRAALDFLERKAQDELSGATSTTQITSLTPTTVAAFLYALRSHGDEMNEEEIDSFKSVRNVCLQVHPRLMNLVPGSESMEPGLQVAAFPAEIQADADDHYRSLYAGKMKVKEMMALLKRTKASDDLAEKQLFACLVHTLFDEYRCFERDYPPRELGIAATVFGQIINEELVDYIPLGIAIRYVLDALRKPPTSPLFTFGIQALQNFTRRLSEWPPLSQALLAIPAIAQGRPNVVRMIHEAQQRPPGRTGGGGADMSAPEEDGVVRAVAQAITSEPFTAIHPDELDDREDQQEPTDDVSDRILFLVNNLSKSNIESKLGDAKALIAPELYNWFAHYLVLQRVSIEPNNHALYASLIDGIEGGPRLMRYILRESMVKIKTLLNNETTLTSSSERTLLKNLASWLGSLTLARNIPIKHRNIAFKELLLQGYKSGRLIAAIPFVCKVLEQCKTSKVFKLPNPWLTAVLALLVELYHYAGLKLNLKFEIEVMCKALQINMVEIEPTSLLDAGAEEEVDATTAGGVVEPVPEPLAEQETMSYSALLQGLFASLPELIVIPPALNMFATNATLKRMLCVAIERAVRDITPPVVERSTTIGNLSTKELVLKDFALESDPAKLSHAAHKMAKDVVGSIAYVTSKDPLRTSMGQHAQRIFLDGGFNEASLPVEALSTIMNDNVDMASKMIERAAQHKAVADLDAMLAPHLAARNGPGPYADPDQSLHISFASSLPDLLRLHPDGLSPAQLRVYDDFGHSPVPRPRPADGSFALQLFNRFGSDFDRLVRLARTADGEEAATLDQLPTDSELLTLLLAVTELVRQQPRKDETALVFASKVVMQLWTIVEDRTPSQEQLATSALVTLLQRLCALSPAAQSEVAAWLVYGDGQWDVRHVPCMVALIKDQLIRVGEIDVQWAQAGADRIEFNAALVQAATKSVATRTQLRHIMSMLRVATESGRGSDLVKAVLHDGAWEQVAVDASFDDAVVYDVMADWFGQWVLAFEEAVNVEKAFVDFASRAQAAGVLHGETTTLFLRVCTHECIKGHALQTALGAGQSQTAYTPVDALAQLVVLLTAFHSRNQVGLLHKMSMVIVLVFVDVHPQPEAGKILYRLLSSIFHLLQQVSHGLGERHVPCVTAVAQSLLTLQPSLFVGYTHAWMSLISHRAFLPNLLAGPEGQGWDAFYLLLQAQVRLLALVRRVGAAGETVRSIYLGAIRIFMLLLHDFPEFLAAYAIPLCDLIPREFVQLRNVILCAYPRQLRLPDPLDPSVDLALLPEARVEPTSAPATLEANDSPVWAEAKALLNAYFADSLSSSSDRLITHIISITTLAPTEGEEQGEEQALMVAQPVLNALVSALGQRVAEGQDEATAKKASDVVNALLSRLDPHRSYLLLSALANQLRFPSASMQFASALLVHLFATPPSGDAAEPSDTPAQVQGQILRVLLERIVVMRPHPWGTLYTMARLLRAQNAALQVTVPGEISRILENIKGSLAQSYPSPALALAQT